MTPAERLEARLRQASREGRLALLPYLVAGFPERASFARLLGAVARHAEVIEIGLPFSDPTADGPIIAAATQRALAAGVHLGWLLETVAGLELPCGLVLMSYTNPLLAFGLERAVDGLLAAGFEGLIVPDLPLEESGELAARAEACGLALVRLTTPVTPPDRELALATATRGFLYAVTRAGTTGAPVAAETLRARLSALRERSPRPLCAGFGLSTPAHVRALRGACDGVIVGSALIELQLQERDPLPWIESLHRAAQAAQPAP